MDLDKEIKELELRFKNSDYQIKDSDHAIVRIAIMRENTNVLSKILEINQHLLYSFNGLAFTIAIYHEKKQSLNFLIDNYYKSKTKISNKEMEEIFKETSLEVASLFND